VGRRTLLRRHQDRAQCLGRESITPRFAVEQHLQDLFEEDPQDPNGAPSDTERALIAEDLDSLPTSEDAEVAAANVTRSDWIPKAGRQDREVKDNFYRRKADLFLSKTEPDASPMKRKGADHTHLGYQAHCVVDGGKARIILGVLVAPLRSPRTSPCWTCFGEPSSGGGCDFLG
jgi:hypothetical protein